MNWLLHRLRPRTREDWLRLLVLMAAAGVMASFGASWKRAWKAKMAVTEVSPSVYGVPVPPGTFFNAALPGSYVSSDGRTPTRVWIADQKGLGLEWLRLWYRSALDRDGWTLQVMASELGGRNVETLVGHHAGLKAVVEVRLSRSDAKANGTRALVLFYPRDGYVRPGAELPSDLETQGR